MTIFFKTWNRLFFLVASEELVLSGLLDASAAGLLELPGASVLLPFSWESGGLVAESPSSGLASEGFESAGLSGFKLLSLTGSATMVLVGVVGVALYYMSRCRGLAAAALFALAIAVVAQNALGVMVLLWVVPVALAVAHQMVAVLVLTACVVLLHATRAPLR